MAASLVALHFNDFDSKGHSELMGIGIPTDVPFPVWRLYKMYPGKMVCKKGTKIPLDDLEFDIATSKPEDLTFDVHTWRPEDDSLRAKVTTYINE